MKKDYIVDLTEEEADKLMDEHWVGELVRCKDCKYHGNICPDYCVNLEQNTNDDFYCAFGERRTPK